MNQVVLKASKGSMLSMDPPAHAEYRKIIAPFFTAKAIHALEPLIYDLTTRILDEVARRGECEFMS